MTKTELENLVDDLTEQLLARQSRIEWLEGQNAKLVELNNLRQRATRYEEVIDTLFDYIGVLRA